jgi:hypothetical protein
MRKKLRRKGLVFIAAYAVIAFTVVLWEGCSEHRNNSGITQTCVKLPHGQTCEH